MLCMSSFHRLSSSCPTENNFKNYYFVLSYDIDLRSPSHFTRTWGSESEEQREEPSLLSPAPQIILLWQFSTSLIKIITFKYYMNTDYMLGNWSTVSDRNFKTSLGWFHSISMNFKRMAPEAQNGQCFMF